MRTRGASVVAVWSLCLALICGLAAGVASAAATVVYPPLSSLVMPTPLPGFAPAPPGPLNGPITSTTFPAFSSDPSATAHTQAALSAVPGYSGYIRTWNDRATTGGQNDVVVYLFRIPDARAASAFVAQIEDWYRAEPSSRPYAVASIPGAAGFALSVSSPQAATEQVVIFATGVYVAWLELASVSGPTNPDPLGPAQAEPVAYSQYVLLHSAVGGAGTPAPAPAPAPAAGGRAATGGSGGHAPLVVALVVVALLAGAAVLLVRRRRRPRGDALRPALGPADEVAVALAGLGAVEISGQPVSMPMGVPCMVPSVDAPLDREPDEAGWYRDPTGDPDTVRYWDGAAWTTHAAVRAPVP